MRKKNDRRLWILPLLAGLAAAFLAGAGPSDKEKMLQRELAGQVLRLQVLANSDSPGDQEVKLQVRDEVLDFLSPLLENADSLEESRRIVEDYLEEVETAARQALGQEASSLPVSAALSSQWFPQRIYGAYTFPEGVYETLRVVIGQGSGHNWWCVLYPGLCFADAVRPVTEEEAEDGEEGTAGEENGTERDGGLKGILPEEVYDFILHPARTKIRFLWF